MRHKDRLSVGLNERVVAQRSDWVMVKRSSRVTSL
jgi:hypothetical protein